MQNVQCPRCGTLVAVDPAAGQVMGCPNCRTPLNTNVDAAEPSVPPTTPQGRTGEVPIAPPPPPGSPVAGSPVAGSPAVGSRAGEMSVAPPPPPGAPARQEVPSPGSPLPVAGAGDSPIVAPLGNTAAANDQATVRAAVQAAVQAAAQAVAQSAVPHAAPAATPVGRLAPSAAEQPDSGTPAKAPSSRPLRRRSKSDNSLYAIMIVSLLGLLAILGGIAWLVTAFSQQEVEPTSPLVATKSSAEPAKSSRSGGPAAKVNTVHVQVRSVEFAAPRGQDESGTTKVFPDKCLIVYLEITNTGRTPVKYASWHLRPYRASRRKSSAETKLVDDRGRRYSAAVLSDRISFKGHTPTATIGVGKSVVDVLLFRVPPGFSPRSVKSLRLTLSGKAVGEKSGYQLKIDGSKIVEL